MKAFRFLINRKANKKEKTLHTHIWAKSLDNFSNKYFPSALLAFWGFQKATLKSLNLQKHIFHRYFFENQEKRIFC
jgi:hypothetical protein